MGEEKKNRTKSVRRHDIFACFCAGNVYANHEFIVTKDLKNVGKCMASEDFPSKNIK